MRRWSLRQSICDLALAISILSSQAEADQILKTTNFVTCGGNSNITVNKVDVSYDDSNKKITFDVSGTSAVEQNVTATLSVTAYGQSIFNNSFNPCDKDTFVEQLCPVPEGTFSAKGSQTIPAEFADQVPAIAFDVPDIAAQAKLELKSADDDDDVACIQSQVSNGKSADVPGLSFIVAGIAGAAVLVTGASALSAAAGGASSGGLGSTSPSGTEVFGWFHGLAMNGMLSVQYPPIYRSFAKNFAFTTGIVGWPQLQKSIDSFRKMTGGNLTNDSYEALQNSTLVFPDGSTSTPDDGMFGKRTLGSLVAILAREVETSTGGSSSGADAVAAPTTLTVSGIQAYVEELSVPTSNVFMTVLLVIAIVIAAIVLGILLVKVILEGWALFGNFPESLAGFRKHYWGSIARAITSLILLLYGIWVLYCIFQFTIGDSWAAKVLAGVTLAIFTGILAFFSIKIWITAQKLQESEGDASGLYDDKSIWVKYSLFYEAYRKNYWWLFVPTILYMFAKGCVLAAADGSGMTQTIALTVIEGLMLIMLLWSRPYERKSGNIINITIQVVRVLSIICILVFVEEFGIAQTTQTVFGVVLIAVQSALTVILAILIAWNAINACCKANPHRKRRKEMEALQRDMDALTPLDARNTLLLNHSQNESFVEKEKPLFTVPSITPNYNLRPSSDRYIVSVEEGLRSAGATIPPLPPAQNYRPLTPGGPGDKQGLLNAGVPPAGVMDGRQPTLPDLGAGYGGYSMGYRPPPARPGWS